MVALSKVRGSSEVEADDVRFIALRSHLSKIIEKAILAKLREGNSKILAVGSYQRGFKEGASTAENVTFALNSLYGNGVTKKKDYLLLADLSKAFNSVNRVKLFDILRKRCVDNVDKRCFHLIE